MHAQYISESSKEFADVRLSMRAVGFSWRRCADEEQAMGAPCSRPVGTAKCGWDWRKPSDDNMSYHMALSKMPGVMALLFLGMSLLWAQGVSPRSGTAESDIKGLIESLPAGSSLKRAMEGGARGTGIHYPWMDHMRQLGVKRALVRTEFLRRHHPTGIKVSRIVYFSKYIEDCAQISDPQRLAQIGASGLDNELRQTAVDRTAAGRWMVIDKPYGTKLGVGTVELFDNEWLPARPAFLTPAPDNPDAFREALDMDDVASVTTLLNGPVQINQRHSALFITQVSDDPCMTRALLKESGEANLRDTEGYTLLMIAVRISAFRNIEALLDAGADVNAKTAQGETALSIAKHNHDSEIIRLLRDAGARE
jgi:hypothetical protein